MKFTYWNIRYWLNGIEQYTSMLSGDDAVMILRELMDHPKIGLIRMEPSILTIEIPLKPIES